MNEFQSIQERLRFKRKQNLLFGLQYERNEVESFLEKSIETLQNGSIWLTGTRNSGKSTVIFFFDLKFIVQ
jgi:hypothetical protein